MVFFGQTQAPFGDRRLTSHLFHFGLIEWFIFGRWSASKATPLSICTIHFGNPLVGVFNIRMGLNGPAPSSIVSKKTSHWPGWKQTINHNLFARCGRSPRVSEWFNITGSKGEFDTPQNWRQIPNRMVRTRKNHGFSGSLPFKHCPNGPNGPNGPFEAQAMANSTEACEAMASFGAKDVCVHLWAVFWNTTGLLM